MTKLACVAVLAGSLAGCAYPKVAMVEVVNAPPPPPHQVAPPPCPDAQPNDYDARAFTGDLLGTLVEVAADCLGSHASHR
jgi:hypothetical protein